MNDNDKKFIVFGTGPLGLWVMLTLAEKGEQVTLVNRKGQIKQKLAKQIEIVAGDATNSNAVHQICKEADTVFHCAMPPYTDWPDKFPPLTRGILEGVARTNARLVYGDNLYMYGPTGGEPVHESLPYAATGHKGMVRAQMAKMLLDAHKKGDVQVAIGRGSDFFGPLVVNAAFGEMFFKAILSGKPANLLGNMEMPHTYTYIKDFAKALVQISEHDEAFGQAWHVPSAETVTTRQFVALVEKEIKQPIKIRAAGGFLVSLLGLFNPMIREVKEMMYEWEAPYVVDHSKFEKTFGAKTTLHTEAIKETVAWYRQQLG